MCLTLPAKVLAVHNLQAEIEISGKSRMVKIGTSDKIGVGDWVLVNADMLVTKINAQEAKEINNLINS